HTDNLDQFLGRPKIFQEELLKRDQVGVATGLAWTPVGGDVLFVEATAMKGRGGLTLTGQLGDVMKESAQAALSHARSHAKEKGLAARRAKIDTVILPSLNKRDLEDVNETIRKEMKFILVDDVKSVFKAALLENKKPLKTAPRRGPRRLRKNAEATV